MSAERRYGESPDVPVAEFLYRHEAEFAAGFLQSAGIPYRLQVDDAGGADAGVTIARPAVLWVRAADAEEAREILGIGAAEDVGADLVPAGGPPAPGRPARPASDGRSPGAAPSARSGAEGPSGGRRDPDAERGLHGLTGTERLVGGLLAVALVALASAGGEGAVPWVGLWEGVALLVGLVLGLSAVSGRAPGPVRGFLRALSGTSR